MDSESQYFQPMIKNIQKLALYETKTRFYIVGSNNTHSKFRILKIDRTEPKELIIYDDKIEYNNRQVKDLLNMIKYGNKNTSHKSSSGLNVIVSAYGIVGFVRFLEGYYMVLITKRHPIARIGYHTIYKIEDTCMTYIPNTGDNKYAEEVRYVKTFMSVDMSSNFYFSYSYDITHTLQYNLSPFHNFPSIPFDESSNTSEKSQKGEETKDKNKAQYSQTKQKVIGVSTSPERKFVWNEFLLKNSELHSQWKVYIIHGFVGQSNISVYGKTLSLVLIGRRSQKYAGTRFLKRGANFQGDVANEVETEQILHDASLSSFTKGRFSSFVQMRGSIPFQWSQDVTKMMPKPQITLDSIDPYCQSAGAHFGSLINQYGAPIIALNLVKKREQKPHESILTHEFIRTIDYLNQFLPKEFHIEHIGFDMARVNKLKEANVLARLSDISNYTIKRIGFFQNWAAYHSQSLKSSQFNIPNRYPSETTGFYQVGVVRVNCVDCLDRTNTAQFALGKCALAYQLCSMGLIDQPKLELDSDIVRVLEGLFEDHGDTLALQYGGSQLVHRVKTYRKIAPLSSHSRDIMQTLSRYYSNTFSDAEKQNGINLFLGIFKPFEETLPLWEKTTDYYFHNLVAAGKLPCCRNTFTSWWGKDSTKMLPLALNQANKGQEYTIEDLVYEYSSTEKLNGFFDFYRPFEITDLNDITSLSNVRDYMATVVPDFSPFSVRSRSGKRKESNRPSNPSVTGISSSSSGNSDIESESDDEDDTRFLAEIEASVTTDTSNSLVSFKSLFPTMKQIYGVEITNPSDLDRALYRKYINIGLITGKGSSDGERRSFTLVQRSAFPLDSTYNVAPPSVPKKSKDIYRDFVLQKQNGPNPPTRNSLLSYQQFFSSRFG